MPIVLEVKYFNNLRLSGLKKERGNLLDEVSMKQAAISCLDDRIDYWEGVISSQSQELSCMLGEKRRQKEGDVAGTTTAPRDKSRAKFVSTRSNGPREAATSRIPSRPEPTSTRSGNSTHPLERSRSGKRDNRGGRLLVSKPRTAPGRTTPGYGHSSRT